MILTPGFCFFSPSTIFKGLLCHLLALGNKSWTAQSCTRSRNNIKLIISREPRSFDLSNHLAEGVAVTLIFPSFNFSTRAVSPLVVSLSKLISQVGGCRLNRILHSSMNVMPGKNHKGYWKFKRTPLKVVFVTQENFLSIIFSKFLHAP